MIALKTVLLLLASNAFMTIAWYGHLKYKSSAIWLVIGASWLIALPEYCLQVPANRWGHGTFTAPQLKIIQEAISVTVFIVFSIAYLHEHPRLTDAIGFLLILAGLAVSLLGGRALPSAG